MEIFCARQLQFWRTLKQDYKFSHSTAVLQSVGSEKGCSGFNRLVVPPLLIPATVTLHWAHKFTYINMTQDFVGVKE